jgi:hypothetical protein
MVAPIALPSSYNATARRRDESAKRKNRREMDRAELSIMYGLRPILGIVASLR